MTVDKTSLPFGDMTLNNTCALVGDPATQYLCTSKLLLWKGYPLVFLFIISWVRYYSGPGSHMEGETPSSCAIALPLTSQNDLCVVTLHLLVSGFSSENWALGAYDLQVLFSSATANISVFSLPKPEMWSTIPRFWEIPLTVFLWESTCNRLNKTVRKRRSGSDLLTVESWHYSHFLRS